MKSLRQRGGHTFESRARGDTTSQGGTFHDCPYTIFKLMTSTLRISDQTSILFVCSLCVRTNIHEYNVNCGGTTGGVRRITHDTDSRKVGGTSKIATHFFLARSVNNGLKRVRRCSAQSATVVTRFGKKLNVQNQRSQFEAPRRRRVELEGRAIIIE